MVSAELTAGADVRGIQPLINGTTSRLAATDPSQMMNWVATLPPESRDNALSSLAMNLPKKAADSGLTADSLLEQIADPIARQLAQRKFAAQAAGCSAR